jgi:hypothetical protein
MRAIINIKVNIKGVRRLSQQSQLVGETGQLTQRYRPKKMFLRRLATIASCHHSVAWEPSWDHLFSLREEMNPTWIHSSMVTTESPPPLSPSYKEWR